MARVGDPGRTRACPHCKATILDSADVCPECQHHLRFGAASHPARTAAPVFRLEGSFANATTDETWEYNLVVAIYDARGTQLARKVVHVGALPPADSRRCLVSLDVQSAGATQSVPEAPKVVRPPSQPLPVAPLRRPRMGPPAPPKPR